MLLEIPFQRTGSVNRIIPPVHHKLLRRIRQFNLQFLIPNPFVQILDHEIDDACNVLFRKRLKQDNLIQPVQKFRTEMAS